MVVNPLSSFFPNFSQVWLQTDVENPSGIFPILFDLFVKVWGLPERFETRGARTFDVVESANNYLQQPGGPELHTQHSAQQNASKIFKLGKIKIKI
jgi:hypothetical protein